MVNTEDPYSGQRCLHWYFERESSGTAQVRALAPEDGLYSFSAMLYGADTTYTIQAQVNGAVCGETLGSAKGYGVWIPASLSQIPVHKGDQMQITITIHGTDGAYGSLDDAALCRTSDLMQTVGGDINADGYCNATDVGLLTDFLLRRTTKISAAADCNQDGKINGFDLALLCKDARSRSKK